MNQLKIVLASALFAVFAACGGGASIEDACENVCECGGEAGNAECISECKAEAKEDKPSDECIECVADADCDDILSCAYECGDESDD